MKKYQLSYEVRKSAIVEAENEDEAIQKGHEGDIVWSEDEITSGLEAIKIN